LDSKIEDAEFKHEEKLTLKAQKILSLEGMQRMQFRSKGIVFQESEIKSR